MERTKKILALLLILTMIMCFGMTACGSNGSDGGSTDPAENQQEEAQNEEESATEAPEIKGLTFESELEKDYADQFNVYRYEGGYKYFHIVDGDDFLLVPEGGEVPEGLDENVTVLQAPVHNIYLAATSQMALFISMDGTDSIMDGPKTNRKNSLMRVKWYTLESTASPTMKCSLMRTADWPSNQR